MITGHDKSLGASPCIKRLPLLTMTWKMPFASAMRDRIRRSTDGVGSKPVPLSALTFAFSWTSSLGTHHIARHIPSI
jgi:hypothetical protein